MKSEVLARGAAVALLVTLWGGANLVGAQDDQGSADNEYGVGLYLGNCDSLVAGAALFDLGDAELETEDYAMSDENADESGDENAESGEDVEQALEDEAGGDETDVESAIGSDNGDEDSSDNSDTEVVVNEDSPLVYVSETDEFQANLVDLVDAPFAVAVRESAQDEASADSDDAEEDDFVACGEFGGAVAGSEIIIPLEGRQGDFSGVALLRAGDGESANASVYLFGPRGEGASSEDGSAEEGSSEDGSTEGDASQSETLDALVNGTPAP